MIKVIFVSILLFGAVASCQVKEDQTEPNLPDTSYTSVEDSVDIMAMLQTQINDAKTRDSLGKITTTLSQTYVKKQQPELIKVYNTYSSETRTSPLSYIKPYLNKYTFLLVFSLSILIILFIRRRKIKSNTGFKKELKEKLKSVSAEVLLPQPPFDLRTIRKNLMITPDPELFDKKLSAKARELQIGKGELILAAKIKTFQMSQLSLNRE